MVVYLLVFVSARQSLGRPRLGVAAIVEAIAPPGHIGELYPREGVWVLGPRGQIKHADGLPIRAPIGHHVGQIARIVRRPRQRQGLRTIRNKRIGVEQHPPLARQAILDVEYGLVGPRRLTVVKVVLARVLRCALAIVLVELPDALGQLLTVGDLFQVGLCDGILRLHPRTHLCRRIALQPTVRIGHLHPKVGVYRAIPTRLRIAALLLARNQHPHSS